MARAAQGAGGAWAPLRHRTYRALWMAQAGSAVGTWMQTVGAQWLLVGHGAALVSLVQTASLLPMLLLSLPAGVLADTVNRRRLLFVTMAANAACAAALAAVTATTAISPTLLLAFTFLIGCGTAMTSPAWQAIQPDLVPREEIPAAAALGGVAVNAARAIGPAIAGFLVAWIGPAVVFALNAASFLVVALTVYAWRAPRRDRGDAEPATAALAAGIRYLRAAPGVRRVIARSALFAAPASALWALLPIVASSRYRLGASGYGLLLGILGVGAIAGVWLLPRMRTRMSTNTILAASALVFALGTAGAAYLPLAATFVLLLLAGAAWIGTLSSLNATIQLTLAAWVRARGMALYLLVFMGSQGVGAFVWGQLAGPLSYQGALLLSAGLLVLSAASVPLLPLHRGTGTYDRTPALDWATPTLVFEPEPADGPVLVASSYRVPAANAVDFVRAMHAVERSRRRTGARRWRLYRDGADPGRYVELFVVPSWGEHLRQHGERWTGADRDWHAAALALTDGTPPEVRHLFPPGVSITGDDDPVEGAEP